MTLLCGCISERDILILLLLYVVIPGILALIAGGFGVAWGIRRLAQAAQSGKSAGRPLRLFCKALLIPLGSSVLLYTLFAQQTMMGVFAVATFGALVLVLIALNLSRRQEVPVPLAKSSSRPAFWLQDILIAVLSYGSQLTLICAHGPSNAIIHLLLAIALSGVLAFAIASDVARQSALGEDPLWRALLFAVIVLINPLAFFAIGLAWFMWRKGLKRARREQARIIDKGVALTA
jgi:hypothetical protein